MVVSVRMHENDMSRLHTRSNAQARAAGAQQRVLGLLGIAIEQSQET